MKYIVLEAKLGEDLMQKIPIIFPNFLVHSDVAKYVAGLLIKQYKRDPEITVASAGFINLKVEKCFGESETCKKAADLDDEFLINSYDYTAGLT